MSGSPGFNFEEIDEEFGDDTDEEQENDGFSLTEEGGAAPEQDADLASDPEQVAQEQTDNSSDVVSDGPQIVDDAEGSTTTGLDPQDDVERTQPAPEPVQELDQREETELRQDAADRLGDRLNDDVSPGEIRFEERDGGLEARLSDAAIEQRESEAEFDRDIQQAQRIEAARQRIVRERASEEPDGLDLNEEGGAMPTDAEAGSPTREGDLAQGADILAGSTDEFVGRVSDDLQRGDIEGAVEEVAGVESPTPGGLAGEFQDADDVGVREDLTTGGVLTGGEEQRLEAAAAAFRRRAGRAAEGAGSPVPRAIDTPTRVLAQQRDLTQRTSVGGVPVVFDPVRDGEGTTERAAESAAESAINAVNVFELGLTGERAGEALEGAGSQIERGREEEVREVGEAFATRVATQTATDIGSNPTSAAGSLLGGFAVGTAAGGVARRLPGVPASDLSGRAALQASRVGRRTASRVRETFSDSPTVARQFLSDDRAQLQFPDSQSVGDGDNNFRPPEGQPRISGSGRVESRAEGRTSTSQFESRTESERAARRQEPATGERRGLGFRSADLEQSRNPGGDLLDETGAVRGFDEPLAGGLVGSLLARSAASSLLAGAQARQEAAARATVSARSGLESNVGLFRDFETAFRFDTDQRTDGRADQRRDTRSETRTDVETAFRTDIRTDIRQDTRQDARVDFGARAELDQRNDAESEDELLESTSAEEEALFTGTGADDDSELLPGFLAETIAAGALLGATAEERTAEESELEGFAGPASFGELPTGAALGGAGEEQEAIEELTDFFDFGGGQ